MSAPESALPSNLPPAEDLQFQRAEYTGGTPARVCAFCKKAAAESYFQVSGAVACPACAEQLRQLQTVPTGRPSMVRATAYGLGAAAAGSAIFALVSLTGFQFSIIAILVGVMVGKAIRKATQGRTTRACQVLAVVLTYGAITTSYLPLMISGAMKHAKAKPATTSQTPAPAPIRPPLKASSALVRFAVATAALIGISLALPFLILAHSPLSGLINLVIIFIGLRQAWRLTAPLHPVLQQAPIQGPFTA